jgi:tripartite-type tricarboxylate transporter receptor subunit TctC
MLCFRQTGWAVGRTGVAMTRWLSTVLMALALGSAAQAQDYPNRQVTIVVGLAAGGITDVTARLYAEVVSRNIGQRIIVDNRPTAAGAVAAAAVQNAPPDGYTLLVFSGSQHASVPAMQQPAPYDPLKFQPVTLLFNIMTMLAVPAGSPAHTVAEFLDYGRKKSGGLSFGSPGAGSPSHLQAAKIATSTHTPMQYVQYRGGAPMMADLVTGRVDFALTSYTAAGPQIADKKLRVLAIDADKRWDKLPDVPTFAEAGLRNVEVASWFALAAPPGTPAPIIAKLHDEFVKASHDPELQKRLAANGTLIVTTTPEEMGRILADEVKATDDLVRATGLRQAH